MFIEDLALDTQQWLICHKTQENQIHLTHPNNYVELAKSNNLVQENINR